MIEGEVKTAASESLKAKIEASNKPRFIRNPSAFDGEGYNLLFMPSFDFETGRKTPKY